MLRCVERNPWSGDINTVAGGMKGVVADPTVVFDLALSFADSSFFIESSFFKTCRGKKEAIRMCSYVIYDFKSTECVLFVFLLCLLS